MCSSLVFARALLAAGTSQQDILGNRNRAGVICQRGESDVHTDYAVAFSPVEKAMYLWSGYPDEVAMETLPF